MAAPCSWRNPEGNVSIWLELNQHLPSECVNHYTMISPQIFPIMMFFFFEHTTACHLQSRCVCSCLKVQFDFSSVVWLAFRFSHCQTGTLDCFLWQRADCCDVFLPVWVKRKSLEWFKQRLWYQHVGYSISECLNRKLRENYKLLTAMQLHKASC